MPLIFPTRKHLKMWAFQKLGIPKCCYLMKNVNDLLIGYQQHFFCDKNNFFSVNLYDLFEKRGFRTFVGRYISRFF